MTIPADMTVFIIEDSLAHARLIEIHLKDIGCFNPTVIIDRGDSAWDLLFGEGKHVGRELPASLLVFLDLNLPIVHGYDILKEMRARPDLAITPVIVVTSSVNPDEEQICRGLGASAFLEKPPSPSILRETFENLGLVQK